MEGGFDRLLRAEESPQEKWLYMRQNPVRAGLVRRPEEWPYQMGLGEALTSLITPLRRLSNSPLTPAPA